MKSDSKDNIANQLVTIGRAEYVSFLEYNIRDVPARIDTGARTSSIWATDVVESNGILRFKLFSHGSDSFTGEVIELSRFSETVVASSIGEAQHRYKVRLSVKLAGRRISSSFTLADRSTQVYPVLIGRNTLRGKFVVDVKSGKVLKDKEAQRTAVLRENLKERGGQ